MKEGVRVYLREWQGVEKMFKVFKGFKGSEGTRIIKGVSKGIVKWRKSV